jgi:predicted nucleic acid-binding protein
MTLFLDTSVLLAASGSATGAARFICRIGPRQGWTLLNSGSCLQETLRNLPKIGPAAAATWETEIQPVLILVPDVLPMGERALVFSKAKDRPVVITALAAEAAVLLTLDRTDFHGELGQEIYGMRIRTPADFLTEQRIAGLI